MNQSELAGRAAVQKSLSAIAELREAIKVMRKFLDDAERELDRNGAEVHEKVRAVSHALAWGAVNANSNVNNAVRLVAESYDNIILMHTEAAND